jgi:hypothetical protein
MTQPPSAWHRVADDLEMLTKHLKQLLDGLHLVATALTAVIVDLARLRAHLNWP